jgi:hypothetical protein
LSDLATSGYYTDIAQRSPTLRRWTQAHTGVRAFAAHPDPLVEASNWVALTVGSHLPFWPLYIFWAAGWQALPSSLLTASMTPLFLAIPTLSRWNGRLGRITTPILGVINTVFTIWVLGINSGTEVFLIPCAALAAVTFRRTERLLMLGLTMLPLVVWYVLQQHPLTSLHQYDASVARDIVILNVCSIGVLIGLFGWFQVDIYRKMEAP